MLRLDDYYVWDSWMADDGELYHLSSFRPRGHWGLPAFGT